MVGSMPHEHLARQDSKLLYPNNSLECVSLDGEVVFYSKSKQGYFGVSGVAADILTTSQRLHTGLRLEDLVDEIASGRSLGAVDKQLILDGVAALIDLGALYEK